MSAAVELTDGVVMLGRRLALDGVSLAIAPGEVVGIVGANGAGKTTLLRAALGLVGLNGGEARLGGRTLASLSELERASLAGYLPQERRVAWNMPAWRIAALGAPQLSPARAHARALSALAETGLPGLAERGVRDMSGGERTRVLIARLLVTRAPLLVADEPTSGLDPASSMRVMEVLCGRARRGAAILVTLHDLTLAARTCDRLAVLAAGRLIALGEPAQAFTAEALREAFDLEGAMMPTPTGPVLAVKRLDQGRAELTP